MALTVLLLMFLGLAPQAGVMAPIDIRGNRLEEATGTSWRVFAVNNHPEGPLAVTGVEEVRQYNPPSTWGVIVRNRSYQPVTSYAMSAAVVLVDGTVKAIQPLPAVKNLAPEQVRRQEVRIVVTTINPTDRVVFFVNEVTREQGPWKAVRSEVAAIIKSVAERLPVP